MHQSHAGEISLLPGIPSAWNEGSFTGMKARGGFTVSCKWRKGKVVWYKISSQQPKKLKLRINDEVKEIASSKR